ncbi:membrane protease subunits, stomatin/prohibitin-like protein [Mycoplasmopsis californica]|uniref:SPFH/Band 7/PHB domain protein n=1 Tax=Mycoplasmopsis equigenitalium TaxID=114883 RepID=A0ABY5J586_9BACT|nr:SPFH domain-containing protein [Mycoplasmopsis equigenitalium]UUD37282.1 SPFH/Band 7/PHB domain protein [Mycoplasmopsis equigenitalium]VEU69409.1 membrane protease subunits, stomatin/prohibitin-like protein [Mycoplasmopsis californica]
MSLWGMPEWASGLVIALFVLAGMIIIWVLAGFKIVSESYFWNIERLGKYRKTWKRGIHFLLHGLDKITLKGHFKEQVKDFHAQSVITKDNAIVVIDTIVYFKIVDPKLFAYGVDKPLEAIDGLTTTTLRNVVGGLELDECLTSRDTVNEKLKAILDEATDPWGIDVIRVEIQEIGVPANIAEAMNKQLSAERERRAEILKANAEKEAAILRAQGDKESKILSAEAENRSLILDGEAKQAFIRSLGDSKLNDKILQFLAIEALGKMADGKATKIIIPPDLGSVAKIMSTIAEVAKTPKTRSTENIEIAPKPVKTTKKATKTASKKPSNNEAIIEEERAGDITLEELIEEIENK